MSDTVEAEIYESFNLPPILFPLPMLHPSPHPPSKLLMRELRTGMNTELYSKLIADLGPQFDEPGWLEETDRKARQLQVRCSVSVVHTPHEHTTP